MMSDANWMRVGFIVFAFLVVQILWHIGKKLDGIYALLDQFREHYLPDDDDDVH